MGYADLNIKKWDDDDTSSVFFFPIKNKSTLAQTLNTEMV